MRRRKWLAALGVLVLLVALAVVTAPMWMIHALKPIARANGIQYDRMEQKADGRLAFHNVTGEKESIRFSAEYLETPSLDAIWKARKNGFNPGETNHVSARNWIVRVNQKESSQTEPARSADQSMANILEEIEEGVEQLHRFLPSADFANGKIVVGAREFTMGNIRWRNDELTSDLSWPGLVSPADIEAHLPPTGPYAFRFRVNPLQVSLRATISREGEQWRLASTNLYQGNRFRAHALFGEDGMLPIEGSLTGKNLKFAGRTFGLEQFAQVTGNLDLQLQEKDYTLKSVVALHREGGDPFSSFESETTDAAPTVSVNVTAQGKKTLNSADAAQVSAGEIKFAEATFQIREGSITPRFDVSFFPTIDLNAMANAFERELTMRIVGPAHRPDVQYQANPSLPPDQIEKLLTGPKSDGVTIGSAQ